MVNITNHQRKPNPQDNPSYSLVWLLAKTTKYQVLYNSYERECKRLQPWWKTVSET
jgi:hypothetical protein